MGKVVWTEQAYQDLESLFDYISHDSVTYARLMVEKILVSVKRLELFPESGRIVPEQHDPCIREIIAGHYRIIYRTQVEGVDILTVRHGASQIDFSAIHNN